MRWVEIPDNCTMCLIKVSLINFRSKKMSDEAENPFGKMIYAYTRAQALADGVLVDVSKMAEKVGFRAPVAVTRTVWQRYIEWKSQDR
jgi:hypothetical protein